MVVGRMVAKEGREEEAAMAQEAVERAWGGVEKVWAVAAMGRAGATTAWVPRAPDAVGQVVAAQATALKAAAVTRA